MKHNILKDISTSNSGCADFTYYNTLMLTCINPRKTHVNLTQKKGDYQ